MIHSNNFDLIRHAAQCNIPNCNEVNCIKIKNLFSHRENCKILQKCKDCLFLERILLVCHKRSYRKNKLILTYICPLSDKYSVLSEHIKHRIKEIEGIYNKYLSKNNKKTITNKINLINEDDVVLELINFCNNRPLGTTG